MILAVAILSLSSKCVFVCQYLGSVAIAVIVYGLIPRLSSSLDLTTKCNNIFSELIESVILMARHPSISKTVAA